MKINLTCCTWFCCNKTMCNWTNYWIIWVFCPFVLHRSSLHSKWQMLKTKAENMSGCFFSPPSWKNFKWPYLRNPSDISPQLLTIYLYSAHRAVIFAIAQLSCSTLQVGKATVLTVALMLQCCVRLSSSVTLCTLCSKKTPTHIFFHISMNNAKI